VRALYEHEIDVGLAFSPSNHVGLATYGFGEGEFVCVYQQGELDEGQDRVDLAELEGKNIISIKDSGPLSDILFKRII